MLTSTRALFLDRDGVINVDNGYVSRPEDFEIIPGVIELLRTARQREYLLFIVTNQSGLARGYFTIEEYTALEAHMREQFSELGIVFDGIYFCPHLPDGVIPEFAVQCSCRKPSPGLILRAAKEHGVDLGQSILLGDKSTDIDAAIAAGVGHAILIGSGGPGAAPFAEATELLESESKC